MIYLKWKLSDGPTGTGPEEVIADRGGYAEVAFGVDGDGYRIGYLIQTADLTDLETWGVSEQTEAEALTFCQQFHADASVGADGRILGPLPATE